MTRRAVPIIITALIVGTPLVRADFTVDRRIDRLFIGAGNASTVAQIPFRANSAGTVVIDVLSWEADALALDKQARRSIHSSRTPGVRGGVNGIDVNGDGDIAFLDPVLFLFDSAMSLVAMVDDDDFSDPMGTADGSISPVDPFLEINLEAGDYLLAIGAFPLSEEDALEGVNRSGGPLTVEMGEIVPGDFGDIRATLTGDVKLTAIPLPHPAAMAGAGLLAVAGLRRRR